MAFGTSNSKTTRHGTTVRLEAFKNDYLFYHRVGSKVTVRGPEQPNPLVQAIPALSAFLPPTITPNVNASNISLTNSYVLRDGTLSGFSIDVTRVTNRSDWKRQLSQWGFSVKLESGEPGLLGHPLPVAGIVAYTTVWVDSELIELDAGDGNQS